MRMSPFAVVGPLMLAALLHPAAADGRQRGVVNGLSVTPSTARTGVEITATVTGVNPCGAVLVDWGDGTAVTHPIVTVPITRTHVYTTPGRYRVSARGQGNCDGEAQAAVRIDAPPATGRPQLRRLDVASPGAIGTPVDMTVQGEGVCTVAMAFGDGNTQELSVELPHTFRHVYGVPRAYNVTASARPPCEGGRHTVRLDIGRQAVAPRISSITVTSNPGAAPGRTTIRVAGTGTCTYLLDYGDGNNERRTVTLPDQVPHVYPAGGKFIVGATAEPPCEGKIQETHSVGRRGRAIDRVVVSPSPAQTRSRVSISIEGRGTCSVTVNFGDGNEEAIEAALPARVFHRYVRPGRYEVLARAQSPCSGEASAVIQVESGRRF
jgi:hypothetical protein